VLEISESFGSPLCGAAALVDGVVVHVELSHLLFLFDVEIYKVLLVVNLADTMS
jgi:hypothetical protein